MAATELVALSKSEAKDFEKQKEIVTKGMHTFVEVGSALRVIRDEKYYREEHKTFEAFCKSTWDIGRDRAYQLIDASEAATNVENFLQKDTPPPAVESHAKELAAIESPEDQAEAWEKVVETAPIDQAGKPRITAAHVASVVEEYLEDEVVPAKPKPEPSIIKDGAGREVTKAMRGQHATGAQIQSAASKLDAVKHEIERLVAEPGGEFLPFAEICELLKTLKGKITQARYWSECPRCKGKVNKKCDRCDGHGYLPYSRRGQLSAEDKAWLGVD